MDILRLMSSRDGFLVIHNALAHNIKAVGFQAWANTVIAELDLGGVAIDLADYGLDDLDGIPQGATVLFSDSAPITRIKLTSGKLYMIRTI